MIHFDRISFERDGKQIFSNLNLEVKSNEKLLIRGKSGIGKSSLLKILLGFERIDSGRVVIGNCNVSPSHIKEIRRQIFYLSQDIDLKNEIVSVMVKEIVSYHPQKHDPLKQLEPMMQFLEMDDILLTRKTAELSGGERQRLGLLIGFLLDRPIWLLDEPTSALEEEMKKKLVHYILDLNKTMIVVSHDRVWTDSDRIRIERW